MPLRTASPKAVLAWAVLFFLVAQLALNVVIDLHLPGMYDPEYGVRIAVLRQRVAEEPERPLLLLMGSSRIVTDFLPEQMPELHDADGRHVLPFNFGHLGAGPVMNLVEYHRLRRAGIRPARVVLEVMPSCLSFEPPSTPTSCMNALDLPVLQRYISPGLVYGRFVRARLQPWLKHRHALLEQFAPAWSTPDGLPEEMHIHLGPLGGADRWVVKATATPDEIHRHTEGTRQDYYPKLQQFVLKEDATRAYRELLDEFRADGVSVVLLLAPEGSAFTSWYPADGMRQIEEFCAMLKREYGVARIDARHWLPDSAFLDSHHVLKSGAEEFSRRLGREALQPWLLGRLAS